MNRWGELAVLARRQYGLVTTQQAATLGISHQRLSDRVSEAGWLRLQRGVFALPGATTSYEQDVCAALLAVGGAGAASHRTAAALWGLAAPPASIEVIVPRTQCPRPRADVTIHRSKTLRTSDVVRYRGLRVTGPPRTLCDISAASGLEELREFVAVAVQRKLTQTERVARRARDLGSFRGAERLGTALRHLTQERTDSWLERRVRRRLRGIGLPPYPGIFAVNDGERRLANLDVAYPDLLVGVEIDGFPWHSTPRQLRADHDRANRLAALGWALLRIGYVQARDDFSGFADQLRMLIATRAA